MPPLTEREGKTYTEVSRHFLKADYKIPGTPNGGLSEDERFWLSYECILRSVFKLLQSVCSGFYSCVLTRFLRGSRWKAPDTIQRLEATLKWRRDFGLYTRVNANLVEKEASLITSNRPELQTQVFNRQSPEICCYLDMIHRAVQLSI